MLFNFEICCHLVKRPKTLLYYKSMAHRNANMTIKNNRWWAEQTRVIQDNKLWTPWKPKTALQHPSYVTTGWLRWAVWFGANHRQPVLSGTQPQHWYQLSRGGLLCSSVWTVLCLLSFPAVNPFHYSYLTHTWTLGLASCGVQLYCYWRSSLPPFINFVQTFSQVKQNKALKLVQGLPSPAPLGTARSINHSKNSDSHQSTTNLPNDLLQAAGCKLHPLVSHPF